MRELSLAVAFLTALLVAVAYAVVVIPDSDSIPGNVLTASGGTVAVDTPFVLTVSMAANSDAATTAETTLTAPGDCTVEEGPQPIAIPTGQSTFGVTWTIECSGLGEHSLTSSLTLIPAPHIADPDDTNNSLTTIINVE